MVENCHLPAKMICRRLKKKKMAQKDMGTGCNTTLDTGDGALGQWTDTQSNQKSRTDWKAAGWIESRSANGQRQRGNLQVRGRIGESDNQREERRGKEGRRAGDGAFVLGRPLSGLATPDWPACLHRVILRVSILFMTIRRSCLFCALFCDGE